jgi:hypothetical protein
VVETGPVVEATVATAEVVAATVEAVVVGLFATVWLVGAAVVLVGATVGGIVGTLGAAVGATVGIPGEGAVKTVSSPQPNNKLLNNNSVTRARPILTRSELTIFFAIVYLLFFTASKPLRAYRNKFL